MNNQIQLVLKSSTTELSLNDRELGIYLTPELDGLTGLPEIRTTSGVNAGYDGGWTSAQNYDARSITIRGVIANEDVATVEQLRRQLTTLAGQGKNEELTLDLVTQAGKAYTIQVRTIALEMSLQKVLTQQEFMLQLRADDPLIYDASETGHEALLQVAQATGGFTIDFELPLAITGSSEETVVNNEGLEQVPTITRMYGALHNPKIINQTTNQFMQIETDLGFAEGDWIEPSEVVSGKDITINGAPEGAPFSKLDLKGNTEQDGTPTPDAPVAVQTVTGENVVKICGKNLLPNQANSTSTGGITMTKNADGSLTFNGTTTTSAVYFNLNQSDSGYVYLESGKTYTLSTSTPLPSNTRLCCRNALGSTTNYIDIYGGNQTSKTKTMTVSDNTFTYFAIYNTGTTVNNLTIYPQLELGSTATDYEPYQEQSYPLSLGSLEFCAIGDYVDKPVKIGDKWYKHKAINKEILDGSGTWTAGGQNNAYIWRAPVSDLVMPSAASVLADIICSHLKVITFSDIYYARDTGIAVPGNGQRICITTMTDVATTKAWLNANTPAVYYPLATPVDEEITNSTLIEQLEALAAATMYNTQTNITTLYADGNEQPTLDVSYFTDKNPDTRDELVIDSRLRTITLNGLDVYHLQAPGSEFLMLAPGENRLALQSDITGDNGYAQVSYKQGYLSI